VEVSMKRTHNTHHTTTTDSSQDNKRASLLNTQHFLVLIDELLLSGEDGFVSFDDVVFGFDDLNLGS
jgi:hypothetical protein